MTGMECPLAAELLGAINRYQAVAMLDPFLPLRYLESADHRVVVVTATPSVTVRRALTGYLYLPTQVRDKKLRNALGGRLVIVDLSSCDAEHINALIEESQDLNAAGHRILAVLEVGVQPRDGLCIAPPRLRQIECCRKADGHGVCQCDDQYQLSVRELLEIYSTTRAGQAARRWAESSPETRDRARQALEDAFENQSRSACVEVEMSPPDRVLPELAALGIRRGSSGWLVPRGRRGVLIRFAHHPAVAVRSESEPITYMLESAQEPTVAMEYNNSALPGWNGHDSLMPATADREPRIFIVHGHTRYHEVARFLSGSTGHDPLVLDEQANKGQILLQKFETNASQVDFAVVLLTADDVARLASSPSEQLIPRARQNVVMELGWFWAKLGGEKIAVLLEEGVEKPSDIEGLVYIKFDTDGAWKLKLSKELQQAGIRCNPTLT